MTPSEVEFSENPRQSTILSYLLKNQNLLVEKVSALEKASAVVVVEIRMLREILQKQAVLEERVRSVENEFNALNGRRAVLHWVITPVVATVVSLAVPAFLKM